MYSIVSIVNSKPENDAHVVNYFIFCYAGEYLALTGDKLNGVEMIACRLATHYSLNAVCSSLCSCNFLYRLCWSVFCFLHDLASPEEACLA